MKKIVIIGGGTGASTLLSGLRNFKVKLSVIVNMVDNGGSTGLLRDQLGVLPPGDVRQCLLALSSTDEETKQLFQYRFNEGDLAGHSFGNLMLAALEKSIGDFGSAVEQASKILKTVGEVIPVTLEPANLVAKVGKKKFIGQITIDHSDLTKLSEISITPIVKANPKALKAIKEADVIVVAPGDFYSSILPNFLVDDISSAIKRSSAKLINVSNLVTKPGHTDNWSVEDFVCGLEEIIDKKFDVILYQDPALDKKNMRGARQGEQAVSYDGTDDRFVGSNLVSPPSSPHKWGESAKDLIERSTIRHGAKKTAAMVMKLIK